MSKAGTENFNPYRKWLGVPEGISEPNHYQLLGIADFESDRDVISNAVDRQMSHVRTFQRGENVSLCQQILTEISRAKVCLLNKKQKKAYDAKLRKSAVVPLEMPESSAVAPDQPPPPPPLSMPAPPTGMPPLATQPVAETPPPVISEAAQIGIPTIGSPKPMDPAEPMAPYSGARPSQSVSSMPSRSVSVGLRARNSRRKSALPTTLYIIGVVAGVTMLGVICWAAIG